MKFALSPLVLCASMVATPVFALDWGVDYAKHEFGLYYNKGEITDYYEESDYTRGMWRRGMDLHIGQVEVSNSGYLRRSVGRYEDGDFYRDDRALTTLRFGYEIADGVTPYIGLGFEKNWEKTREEGYSESYKSGATALILGADARFSNVTLGAEMRDWFIADSYTNDAQTWLLAGEYQIDPDTAVFALAHYQQVYSRANADIFLGATRETAQYDAYVLYKNTLERTGRRFTGQTLYGGLTWKLDNGLRLLGQFEAILADEYSYYEDETFIADLGVGYRFLPNWTADVVMRNLGTDHDQAVEFLVTYEMGDKRRRLMDRIDTTITEAGAGYSSAKYYE